MTTGLDQGYRAFKAKLITTSAPFDPNTGSGNELDPARYLKRPGIDFLRPWIAIRNGPAFQWPLGMEGYTLSVDPVLGIHKFIGDNKVTVDVIHAGEERFTLTGNFIGDSAPDQIFALRDLVYRGTKEEGKILYIPELFAHAQRVQVVHFEASRAEEDRGRDARYTLEVVRIGLINNGTNLRRVRGAPRIPSLVSGKGTTANLVRADSKHNTLRKIAVWKLGRADGWRALYLVNRKWFDDHGIHLAKAPNYRLPLGTIIHY